MAFAPDEPFPKVPGDDIRAQDWNDLVAEVQHLNAQIATAIVSGGEARIASIEAQLANLARRLDVLEDQQAPEPEE